MIHCHPSRNFWEPSAKVHASCDWAARFHLNTGTRRPKVENASQMFSETALKPSTASKAHNGFECLSLCCLMGFNDFAQLFTDPHDPRDLRQVSVGQMAPRPRFVG